MDSERNAATRREPIGVLGGTFDPIHVGHLLLAEHAREQLGLSRVVFVPSARPPHKLTEPVTDPEHRYAMALLATATHLRFCVSRRELDRQGPSYTITTVRELAAEGFDPIYWIVGADAALDLPNWYEAEAILREARVVAVARPGFCLDRLAEALGPRRAQMVTVLQAPQFDVSSTAIREALARGASTRYLLDDAVEAYVRKHGLYTAGDTLRQSRGRQQQGPPDGVR